MTKQEKYDGGEFMKTFFALIVISILFPPITQAASRQKILIVLNDGYRPEEYLLPKKVFEQSGYEIKIAGHYLEPIYPSHKYLAEV